MKTKKLNISLLYAEDEQDTRKNVSDILNRRINKFFVAKNGIEALEIYKKHQPELVLTDIQMPGLSGLQLAEQIKQINPQAKIIMMTAFTDTDYLLKAIELQVDGFLVKPVIKEKLISAVQKQTDIILLERKTKEQEKELIKREEKYRLLFNHLPYGGEVLDTTGIIIDCSPSTASMLGYELHELIGKPITNFVDAESITRFNQNFPKALKGKPLSLEACMIHKNGTKLNILRATQPIVNNNGEVESILALNINISDRIKAEEALKASQKKFMDMADLLPQIIYETDLEGNITYTNEKGFTTFGYTPEILNEGFNILSTIQPQDIPRAKQNILDIMSGKPVEDHEYYALRKDGSRFPVSLYSKPIFKDNIAIGMRGVVVDITYQKEAEANIRKSRDQYQLLFNQVADPIVIFDQETKLFLACNTAMVNKYKYSQEEILSMTPLDLHPPDEDIELVKRNIDNKNSMVPNEYQHKGKDGKIYNVEIHTERITYNGIESWISIIRDITDRKKAEEAIREHNYELQERNTELDAFSHTVAHDLKNPLGSISGFVDLLHDRYSILSNIDREKYINAIIGSNNKALQIINSLLLFASVRKEEIKTSELNMGHIVAEAMVRFELKINKTNASIKLPRNWPTVIGFFPWVEEVWANYISNALKYGGSPPLIEIGFDTEESNGIPKGMVRFWIRDNGLGLTKENQEVIFKRFERLDQANTQGHGLGLSIAQRIIEKLGGEVGLESKLGEGSLFYFTLPLSTTSKLKTSNLPVHDSLSEGGKPETSQPDNLPVRHSFDEGEKPSNLKILIAEDEQTSDDLLTILMQSFSKEILHTKNGKETIEICRANPDIDLILMDIRMPILSGYEATRKIREFNKDIIIIAQTAFALPGDYKKAIDAGCNDHITKPILKNKLMELIQRYFSHLGNN